jgi:hypothetical protein
MVTASFIPSGSSQLKEPFRGGCAARLNPKYAKAPATMRLTQLSHIGTLQLPITTLQPKTIRARCSRHTREKIEAATSK